MSTRRIDGLRLAGSRGGPEFQTSIERLNQAAMMTPTEMSKRLAEFMASFPTAAEFTARASQAMRPTS